MMFHEDKQRLFLTVNHALSMLEMKVKLRDRVYSHEKPIVGVIFNSTFNQIVSACQAGTISFWLVDTGQRVKNISRSHNDAELTCLAQDPSGNRFYTGSTDGTIKIWDMNGHCHHTLICFGGTHAEVGQVVILKRAIIVMGSSNHFTVFRTTNFRDHYVYPSEWKGGPEHQDDVLTGISLPPNGLVTASYDGEIIVWNINSELAARRMTQRCKRMNQDVPDFLFNISRVMLLTNRKHIGSGSKYGANLVTCGGNGIVRFWNVYACILIGEFLAHPKASSIIMALDSTCEYLATGDIDGFVKIWNIKDYCWDEGELEVDDPPELISQWSAHVDLISGLAFCTRLEGRMFLITASTDCGVSLWTMYGTKVGVFGQEIRWKLELVQLDHANISLTSSETNPVRDISELVADQYRSTSGKDSTESVVSEDPEFRVDNISPFPEEAAPEEIREILSNYRMNAWNHTLLGKEYQKGRMKKRQRKQPNIITDLPFMVGDRSRRPNYGPYYYLLLSKFDQIEELEQPDFMEHPEEYFMDKDELVSVTNQSEFPFALDAAATKEQHNVHAEAVPQLKFDDRKLFPPSILHFEEQMKRTNRYLNKTSLSGAPLTPTFRLGDQHSDPLMTRASSITSMQYPSPVSSRLTGRSSSSRKHDRTISSYTK